MALVAKTETGAGAGAGAGFRAFRSKLGAALVSLGFDPTIIIAIISAILPLILQMCNPKTMRRRFVNRSRLALNILDECERRGITKEDGSSIDFRDAFVLADATFDLADAASEDELLAFKHDCCAEKG